eukprot:TRINITY_DN2490_c0_g1_i1.p1 TRINITY_DN2490_c0_g1~~TRINITY_DN2490_c0_g1_i1.p1  ORF type:complete len:122 (-),score=42.90 TRINITY_DN2490_c0_g1_i1:140-505(-)
MSQVDVTERTIATNADGTLTSVANPVLLEAFKLRMDMGELPEQQPPAGYDQEEPVLGVSGGGGGGGGGEVGGAVDSEEKAEVELTQTDHLNKSLLQAFMMNVPVIEDQEEGDGEGEGEWEY